MLQPHLSSKPVVMQKDLHQRVSDFIIHCKNVGEYSRSTYYKEDAWLRAVSDLGTSILPMTREKTKAPTAQLAKMILCKQDVMRKILPCPANSSYSNTLMKLDNIINDCKQQLQYAKN